MASKKKESEGIALLSMYNDEDDEMEDLNEEDEAKDAGNYDGEGEYSKESDRRATDSEENMLPLPPYEESTLTTSPYRQSQPLDFQRKKGGKLAIVDYGHDEIALSPEAEEGEIVSLSQLIFGTGVQTANADVNETTTTLATLPQASEQLDSKQSDEMKFNATESEAEDVKEDGNISLELPKEVDPIDKFLPPPPKEKCSDELQEKINKFLVYKRCGKSFNAEVRNRKDYRNPDFLLHAVRYQDIDQIGSCFSKDVFDPHGYDKSDYYDEIEADMKRELERKEQERKKNQKVEFISGAQPTPPKLNMPIPGVPTVASTGFHSGFHPNPTATDAVTRDGRQNKKSKWDKVDGDRRNPLPSGGQDSVSNTGAQAALLSAANAGTGYTAFAQQRRREAEEKRSGERKLDRKS